MSHISKQKVSIKNANEKTLEQALRIMVEQFGYTQKDHYVEWGGKVVKSKFCLHHPTYAPRGFELKVVQGGIQTKGDFYGGSQKTIEEQITQSYLATAFKGGLGVGYKVETTVKLINNKKQLILTATGY